VVVILYRPGQSRETGGIVALTGGPRSRRVKTRELTKSVRDGRRQYCRRKDQRRGRALSSRQLGLKPVEGPGSVGGSPALLGPRQFGETIRPPVGASSLFPGGRCRCFADVFLPREARLSSTRRAKVGVGLMDIYSGPGGDGCIPLGSPPSATFVGSETVNALGGVQVSMSLHF